MDDNQPLDWTDEDLEKLIAKLANSAEEDGGLFSGAIASNGIPSTITFSPIKVTRITTSSDGWPLALYCPLCKTTVFKLDPWGIKPVYGDYFLVKGVCADDEVGFKHNMEMAMVLPEKRHLPKLMFSNPSARQVLSWWGKMAL